MNIIKTARQLLTIYEDLRRRRGGGWDFDKGELYDFDQTWPSTALGFGGCGGSAMTTERTYVFVPEGTRSAYVYFGDRFAYFIKSVNDTFLTDLSSENMDTVQMSGKYVFK